MSIAFGAFLLASAILLWVPVSKASKAEDTSAPAIARVQGSDVSINDAMKGGSSFQDISSGNVVTVHSGTARLQLAAGGQVSICGPAKLTVLDSGGGEVTLALEFGRIQLDLPPSAQLKILTPAIVARPIEIDRGKRNMTIGLDQNDSLCVVASSGAVQLEQQFTGERLTIPESGDFSLQGGQLVPVVDSGQSCKCELLPELTPSEPSPYPAPESATLVPPAVAAPSTMDNSTVPQTSSDQSSVQVGVLSGANEQHPSAAPEKQPSAAPAPDEAQASYKIILPPMVFSSALPSPPPATPTPETALLIREVHVDPDWQFTGHVDSPDFAKAISGALGESGTTAQQPGAPAAASEKKRGFWSKVKRLFSGGAT